MRVWGRRLGSSVLREGGVRFAVGAVEVGGEKSRFS